MLLNIQFLRFVAAMLVVLYHTAAQVPDSTSAVHGLFAVGQAIGFAGVDITFLSGTPLGLTAMSYLALMLLILAYSVWHYQSLERPLHRLFKRWIGL